MSARDKARLDWMTRHRVSLEHDHYITATLAWAVFDADSITVGTGETPRQAIDFAMREDARREKGARE